MVNEYRFSEKRIQILWSPLLKKCRNKVKISIFPVRKPAKGSFFFNFVAGELKEL